MTANSPSPSASMGASIALRLLSVWPTQPSMRFVTSSLHVKHLPVICLGRHHEGPVFLAERESNYPREWPPSSHTDITCSCETHRSYGRCMDATSGSPGF